MTTQIKFDKSVCIIISRKTAITKRGQDWLIEQGLTSAPTQYRLYGRRLLPVPRSQAILASCPDTFSLRSTVFEPWPQKHLELHDGVALAAPDDCKYCDITFNSSSLLLDLCTVKQSVKYELPGLIRTGEWTQVDWWKVQSTTEETFGYMTMHHALKDNQKNNIMN